MVNKNEVVLMSQGACGAFVHGLEDEYMGKCCYSNYGVAESDMICP